LRPCFDRRLWLRRQRFALQRAASSANGAAHEAPGSGTCSGGGAIRAGAQIPERLRTRSSVARWMPPHIREMRHSPRYFGQMTSARPLSPARESCVPRCRIVRLAVEVFDTEGMRPSRLESCRTTDRVLS
jgi:hypothetical protein